MFTKKKVLGKKEKQTYVKVKQVAIKEIVDLKSKENAWRHFRSAIQMINRCRYACGKILIYSNLSPELNQSTCLYLLIYQFIDHFVCLSVNFCLLISLSVAYRSIYQYQYFPVCS